MGKQPQKRIPASYAFPYFRLGQRRTRPRLHNITLCQSDHQLSSAKNYGKYFKQAFTAFIFPLRMEPHPGCACQHSRNNTPYNIMIIMCHKASCPQPDKNHKPDLKTCWPSYMAEDRIFMACCPKRHKNRHFNKFTRYNMYGTSECF